MTINDGGMQIIMTSESLRLEAYPDPASPRAKHRHETGVDDPSLSGAPWTIGYGHTSGVVEGDRITEEEADRLLDIDIDMACRVVTQHVTYRLNVNQFSALVSFVMNVGPGKAGVKDGFVVLKDGSQSTMLRRLNAGGPLAASNEFEKWVHAGGVEMPGLVKRRAAERDLFLEVPS